MRNLLHRLAAAFFGCLFICPALVLAAPEYNQEPFRIGAVLPLSGEMATWGARLREGIELALESMSAADRRLLQVIFEDDQLRSASSVSAFKKLRAQNSIDAVIIFGSAIGHAVGPLAEKEQVVAIAVGASDRKVTEGKRFVFTHWVSPEMEAKAMVPEIAARGYKRLALIVHEQEGILSIASALKEELSRAGKQNLVALERSFLPEESDFRSLLPVIKQKNIDAVCGILFPAGQGLLARQLREAEFSGEIFGADTIEDPAAVTASQGALVGAWYTNGEVGTVQFQERYHTRFGKLPGPSSSNAYDSILLLLSAVKHAGRETKAVADYLRTLASFEGACGVYQATGDGRFTLPAVVKVITASGFRNK